LNPPELPFAGLGPRCPENCWQVSQHDLDLLLRRELPALPLLAHPPSIGDQSDHLAQALKLGETSTRHQGPRQADLIRDRLSRLPLGQVGVWLILSEGAWSQS